MKIRLQTRLILAFAIPGLIVLGLAATVHVTASRIARHAERAQVQGRESFGEAMDAQKLKLHAVQVQQWLTDISATRGLDGLNGGFTKAEEHAKQFREILARFRNGAGSQKEIEELAGIATAFEAYNEQGKVMARAYVEGGPDSGNKLMAAVDKQADRLTSAVDPFVERHSLEGQEALSELTAAAGGIRVTVWFTAVVAFAIAVGVGIWMGGSIARPIRRAIVHFAATAKGDLTNDVPRDLLRRGDEIGDFARGMQDMIDGWRVLLSDITNGVQTLATSSSELSAVSTQTGTGVQAMSEKAATVAAAAEESSANTISVASSMEEASTNLGSVASATEELSATVAEIASHSEKARTIGEEAMNQAQSITSLMQQLGEAAQEIGKVTETITDISSQTNLLALNATIEAARAGTSGKGFAVVANEIKELARQTATATEDIKSKIAGVQTSTGSAIADIRKITAVIREVGHIVSTIAASIEEQATVTRDVAGNIAQASNGVTDANQRISQTAAVARSIAQDIATVNDAVADIRMGGEQVQASASALSNLAEQLQSLIGRFRIPSSETIASAEIRVARNFKGSAEPRMELAA